MDNHPTNDFVPPEEAVYSKVSDTLRVIQTSYIALLGAESANLRGHAFDQLIIQQSPSTVIGICGATGSGKSSVANALLDADILPTSGSRACTAAPIRISYHNEEEPKAEITFMAYDQLLNDFRLLKKDLEGAGSSSLLEDSPGDRLREKLQAMYPSLEMSDLSSGNLDDIMQTEPEIYSRLGNVEVIEHAEDFAIELKKYVADNNPLGQDKPTVFSFWPLIKEVDIHCNADILASGCILVDLPGSMDTNSARGGIAQDYIKDCDHIFVVAPISRAVNDNAARALLGDSFKTQMLNGRFQADKSAITFIATKTDDILPSEAAKDLDLSMDYDYQEITDNIVRKQQLIADSQTTKQRTEHELRQQKKRLNTEKTRESAIKMARQQRKKRKYQGDSSERASKRQRLDEDQTDSDSDSSEDEDIPRITMIPGQPDFVDSSHSTEKLKNALKLCQNRMTQLETNITQAKASLQAVLQDIKTTEDTIGDLEREKRAHCSALRSDASKAALQKDFILGLKQLNAKLRRGTGLPAEDYSQVRLPVHTVSSREYSKIITKDGENPNGQPTCFVDVEETGIPGLRRWCAELCRPSQQATFKEYRSELDALLLGIEAALRSSPGVTPEDREALSDAWNLPVDEATGLRRHTGPKRVQLEQWIDQAFEEVLVKVTRELTYKFRDTLESKCLLGAKTASEKALGQLEDFIAPLPWQTYRAMLRRYGQSSVTRDLNSTLVSPFTDTIALEWIRLFTDGHFGTFNDKSLDVVHRFLGEFKASAANSLHGRIEEQEERCLDEARIALGKCVRQVETVLTSEQRRISRLLAPGIQDQLIPGYDLALEEKGKGSIARQKIVFHDYLEEHKHDIFQNNAQKITENLTDAVKTIRNGLEKSLKDLRKKIHANMSVVWGKEADATDVQDRETRTSITTSVAHVRDIVSDMTD